MPNVGSFLQHFKHLGELQLGGKRSSEPIFTNNDGKVYPTVKVLNHELSNWESDDDPEGVLKLLDALPNLEEFKLYLSCRIGLVNEAEEILRLAGILKEVKSRVKSFKLGLDCYIRDTKRLREEIERVFGDTRGNVRKGEYAKLYNY